MHAGKFLEAVSEEAKTFNTWLLKNFNSCLPEKVKSILEEDPDRSPYFEAARIRRARVRALFGVDQLGFIWVDSVLLKAMDLEFQSKYHQLYLALREASTGAPTSKPWDAGNDAAAVVAPGTKAAGDWPSQTKNEALPDEVKKPRLRSPLPRYIYDALAKNKSWKLTRNKADQIAEKLGIDLTTESAAERHWNNCQQAYGRAIRARKQLS